jgi:formiminoglutamase
VKPDPNWPRASEWLAGEHESDPVGHLAILGAPVRRGSLSGGRFDAAPQAIRDALAHYSTWDEPGAHGSEVAELAWRGVDVRAIALEDLGDLDVLEATPEEAFDPIRKHIGRALEGSEAAVVLGGDNSVTRPGVHGLGLPLARVGLLTLDAHFDLRDTTDGLSNGNPVRALIEDGLPGGNVWQVGIQPFANSLTYHGVAHEAGVSVTTAEHVRRHGIERAVANALSQLARRGVETIYVDADLDVLDRAFAPACPGSRPGGLTPMELRQAVRLCGRFPLVRAIDVVEVDPKQDVANVTVLAAASCLLAFAAGVAGRLGAAEKPEGGGT